jgi:NADPH:quinone reductase-like Zn-dependent oxidoreductase
MTSESMRAVLVKDGKGPVQNLYIGETPKPKPGAGQVLVKACLSY